MYLSIRTITYIRRLCERYADILDVDFVLVDTSPSLGILNKTIISTVDGFIIPAQLDMFSLYGIRNIGNSLELWGKELNVIYRLISEETGLACFVADDPLTAVAIGTGKILEEPRFLKKLSLVSTF